MPDCLIFFFLVTELPFQKFLCAPSWGEICLPPVVLKCCITQCTDKQTFGYVLIASVETVTFSGIADTVVFLLK